MLDKEKANKNKLFSSRLFVLHILFSIYVVTLGIYLFGVQIFDIRHCKIKAINQRKADSFVLRGNIYDRNGIKLATDTVYYDIFERRDDFQHTEDELAKILAPILKISHASLVQKLKQNTPLVSLKKNVDRHTRDAIAKLKLREIPIDKKSIRTYPQGALAAHVLGYYNFDANVASGVEYTAKDKLESSNKGASFEKTPTGKIIYNISTDPIATTLRVRISLLP